MSDTDFPRYLITKRRVTDEKQTHKVSQTGEPTTKEQLVNWRRSESEKHEAEGRRDALEYDELSVRGFGERLESMCRSMEN